MSFGINIGGESGFWLTNPDDSAIYVFHEKILCYGTDWTGPLVLLTDPNWPTTIPVTEPPPLVFLEIADGKKRDYSYLSWTDTTPYKYAITTHGMDDAGTPTDTFYAYVFRRVTATMPIQRTKDYGIEVYTSSGTTLLGGEKPLMVRGHMELPSVSIGNNSIDSYGTPVTIPTGMVKPCVNMRVGEVWDDSKYNETYIVFWESYNGKTQLRPRMHQPGIVKNLGGTINEQTVLFIDGADYD